MTVDEILAEKDVPVVAVDERGIITFINEAFEQAYGWKRAELAGQPLVEIIPPHMRATHLVGFSRLLSTEKPTLLGKPLRLPIQCKDGQQLDAEHMIAANKQDGKWRIAATIQVVIRGSDAA